jgi:hypothetical protein
VAVLANPVGRLCPHLWHDLVQACDLLVSKRGALAERGNARLPENLINVRVADAGEKFPAGEGTLNLAPERTNLLSGLL